MEVSFLIFPWENWFLICRKLYNNKYTNEIKIIVIKSKIQIINKTIKKLIKGASCKTEKKTYFNNRRLIYDKISINNFYNYKWFLTKQVFHSFQFLLMEWDNFEVKSFGRNKSGVRISRTTPSFLMIDFLLWGIRVEWYLKWSHFCILHPFNSNIF